MEKSVLATRALVPSAQALRTGSPPARPVRAGHFCARSMHHPYASIRRELFRATILWVGNLRLPHPAFNAKMNKNEEHTHKPLQPTILAVGPRPLWWSWAHGQKNIFAKNIFAKMSKMTPFSKNHFDFFGDRDFLLATRQPPLGATSPRLRN